MEALMVYHAGTPPPAAWDWPAPATAGKPSKQVTGTRVVEDKENVLPTGTPRGGLQLPLFASSGGKQAEQPARRPLSDVTRQYDALTSSQGICIGAMGGGGFGLPMGPTPHTTCSQEAAAAAEMEARAAAAAAAAKARHASARRQALRSMR